MYDFAISFLGTYLFYIIVIITIFIFIKNSGFAVKKEHVYTFIALVLAYLLARIAGIFYFHEQPFATLGFNPIIEHDVDNSFPSDHATISTVLSVSTFIQNKAAGIICFIIVILLGLGRVLGGVHYPIDIIAGVSIGLISIFISKYVYESFLPTGD